MEPEYCLHLRDVLFTILSAVSEKSAILTLKLFKAEVSDLMQMQKRDDLKLWRDLLLFD